MCRVANIVQKNNYLNLPNEIWGGYSWCEKIEKYNWKSEFTIYWSIPANIE